MNNSQKLNIIERIVCSKFGVNVNEHKKHYHSRKMPYIDIRCMVNTIAKSFKISLTCIGEYSGGKTHATVYNSIKICNNLCATDKDFELKYNVCKQAAVAAINGDVINYHVFTTDELLKFINDLNGYYGVKNKIDGICF